MHHSYLDKYANGNSVFHRLDSRVKCLAAVVYTIFILSLPAVSPVAALCYAVAPFGMLVFAGVPVWFVFRRILVVCPFVLILALSCPLYDKNPHIVHFGERSFSITGGWLRCGTILTKFFATMMTLFAMTCTTRFGDILAGLQRMHIPNILIIQLGFVYRYLFVLVDRVHHVLRARSARKLRYLGFGREIRIAAAMIGSLFLHSIESAQRIHIAMQARGFTGTFYPIRPLRMSKGDGVFVGIFIVLCAALYGLINPLFL